MKDSVKYYTNKYVDLRECNKEFYKTTEFIMNHPLEERIRIIEEALMKEIEAIVFEQISSELQRDLLSLSCKSKQIIAKGSDHCIMDEKPSYVIDIIIEMVSKSTY